MWPRTMLLLCLLAALSGTPLRQVEAAGDFARRFAESEQGPIIEMVDGGVGDEAELSILKDGGDPASDPSAIFPDLGDVPPSPPASASSRPGIGDRRGDDPSGPLPIGDAGRFAWLQCFRF